MLVIDASAYPHIVEAILTEPVAWRAARSLNREWRGVIDTALSVVTVDCIHVIIATRISLTTTPTLRFPQRTLDIYQALAMHLGRLPPIGRLRIKFTNQWPGLSYPIFFFQLLGKVHTIRLLYPCYQWTSPCATLVNDNELPSRVPPSLRKFVMVKHNLTPIRDFCLKQLPRSVVELTLSFHNWDQWNTDAVPYYQVAQNFCRPLAAPLIRGRTINIVHCVDIHHDHKQVWFAAMVRLEVVRILRNRGSFTNEHVDKVMSRLKFFDIGEYRQLNPDEI